MNFRKKGISLVSLVITIIVLIILTTTVIIMLSSGGIINKSNEAVFKSDIRTFQEDLLQNVLNKQMNFTISDKEEVYPGGTLDFNEIKSCINSFSNKYENKLGICKGEIRYSRVASFTIEEIEWLNELGIKAMPLDDHEVQSIFKYDYEYVIHQDEGYAEITGISNQPIFYFNSRDGVYYESGYYTAIGVDNSGILIMPDTVDGIPIKEIRSEAFNGVSSIKHVVMSDDIIEIGEMAFINCENLEDIVLSKKLTTIGEMAFAGCTMLKEIEIPSGVTSIGDGAFSCCESLVDITIPNQLTSIDGVFDSCYGLKTVNIPSSVTSMQNSFSNCSALEIIRIDKPRNQVEAMDGYEEKWDAVEAGSDPEIICNDDANW